MLCVLHCSKSASCLVSSSCVACWYVSVVKQRDCLKFRLDYLLEMYMDNNRQQCCLISSAVHRHPSSCSLHFCTVYICSPDVECRVWHKSCWYFSFLTYKPHDRIYFVTWIKFYWTFPQKLSYGIGNNKQRCGGDAHDLSLTNCDGVFAYHKTGLDHVTTLSLTCDPLSVSSCAVYKCILLILYDIHDFFGHC